MFNNQGITAVPQVHPYVLMVQHPAFMPALTNLAGSCQSDIDLVKNGEGFRPTMYHDTKGIATICYGYNLERGNARSDLSSVGANYDAVMSGASMSQSQCTTLLDKEMGKARSGAQAVFGSLKCSCAQAVAVDMTYNLGQSGIGGFHHFIADMKAGNWKQAQVDGKDSLWCRQVGSRCSRNMHQIGMC